MGDYKKRLTNDDFGQCLRKLRKQPVDIVIKRKEEMEKCNHLFILLKEGEWINGFHSSDCCYEPNIVECVHCGLTNKFMEIEERFLEPGSNYTHNTLFPSHYNKKTLETEIFIKTFKNAYIRGGKSFDESAINLISKEPLYTTHPGFLYEMALMIKPNGNDEELFQIMKELWQIETREEKLQLLTLDKAEILIKRYYDTKTKDILKKDLPIYLKVLCRIYYLFYETKPNLLDKDIRNKIQMVIFIINCYGISYEDCYDFINAPLIPYSTKLYYIIKELLSYSFIEEKDIEIELKEIFEDGIRKIKNDVRENLQGEFDTEKLMEFCNLTWEELYVTKSDTKKVLNLKLLR